ncbi:MAG: serine protein kinase RIO, partial [Nitrosopumilaceae archaeon]|nr:serine protein kinase RIO [Nitrosopumilaceae archaeon]NIT99476.1 serine protein kinase RIO [Nitrosopumilaceae archaeon]NIU85835.1 serine protein kinase RIO [Nitrosopumilaceae archaeon]NIV64692.1 serine protein kinase RIO [Nitrosopumilaceae archaeon]NIX60079.1 serine protein kinase RIO [Nitrosopumilaceae archaeon]
MSEDLDKKLMDKIDRKLLAKSKRGKLSDGFDKNKVVNEVLDRSTVMTLYKMITSHIISYVNGVVSAGKESLVFWAVNESGKDVALKIYLVSTTSFKKRLQYIQGDPRFSKIKGGTKNLVYAWAKKEFRNLSQCYENNLPVPNPIYISNNVLAMEFIGTEGRSASRLVESEVDEEDYKSCVDILKQLYKKAKLIHGDFSEYNIFKTENGLVVFDMGSAVDIRHP